MQERGLDGKLGLANPTTTCRTQGAVDRVESVGAGRNENLKALVECPLTDGTDRHRARVYKAERTARLPANDVCRLVGAADPRALFARQRVRLENAQESL